VFAAPDRSRARTAARALPLLGTLLLGAALPGAAPAAARQAPAAERGVEVFEATIPQLQRAMERGEVTAVQLVEAYLARIEAYDRRGPALNAVLWIDPEARARAASLDRERTERGPRGPLHGIPVILKDNFDTSDLPTSGGSVALAGHRPREDAFQVRRLREAGAVILAKTNLHELAAGITTVSSLGGQTRNPYDPARNPGGSSGGTGAAVAASFGAVGWGTDTCGSIRLPAAVHSLFGLRPTKGLSSIDGVIPLSTTQDVAGPLARTAIDLALALDATVGPDPADPATRVLEGRPLPRFADALDADALRGARIGVLRQHFGEGPQEREVGRMMDDALAAMERRGAVLVEIEIAGLDSLLAGSGVIDYEFKWDLMDYLARTPGAPVDSLGEILARGLHHRELEERFRVRNQRGTREGPEYHAALARQEEVRRVVLAALDAERLDALAYPTSRREVARIGEPALGLNCQLSAVTGMPALSVPAGFTERGLPVGLELLGRPLADARLVALGYAYEQAERPRRPPASTPPLVDGRAPAPVAFGVEATAAGMDPPAAVARGEAHGRFTLDPAGGTLAWEVRVAGVPAAEVHAVVLQRVGLDGAGSVLHRLLPPGAAAGAGTLELDAALRDALERGDVHLQLYTRAHPHGAARGRLRLPG
jgi:amidase